MDILNQSPEPEDDRAPEYRRSLDERQARTELSISDGQREAYLACQEENSPQRDARHIHRCGCGSRWVCAVEGCGMGKDAECIRCFAGGRE